MKITNIRDTQEILGPRYFLLVEDPHGWEPGHSTDIVELWLDQGKHYWWYSYKTDYKPAVAEVTESQAKKLVDKGYTFDIVKEDGVKNMKITNIKSNISDLVLNEDENGWKTTNGNFSLHPLFKKLLKPDQGYWWEDKSDSNKVATVEVTNDQATELAEAGYKFNVVKDNEVMNETEGPKFYALQGKYGLVFKLPDNFNKGFRAGQVTTHSIDSGLGYLIFADLKKAQEIADYSYPAEGLDKLRVVEIDPIAKKVIKVIGEPKPSKWRVAWSGGEPTPKWFKGDMVTDWSLITSKSDATVFDTLKEAENVVEYLSLTSLYVIEDK